MTRNAVRREQWSAKHTMNLALILAALASVVLLSIFADGQYVREVLAFVGGLLIPGSPVATLVGRSERLSKPEDGDDTGRPTRIP
jgi:hypothetical protein